MLYYYWSWIFHILPTQGEVFQWKYLLQASPWLRRLSVIRSGFHLLLLNNLCYNIPLAFFTVLMFSSQIYVLKFLFRLPHCQIIVNHQRLNLDRINKNTIFTIAMEEKNLLETRLTVEFANFITVGKKMLFQHSCKLIDPTLHLDGWSIIFQLIWNL